MKYSEYDLRAMGHCGKTYNVIDIEAHIKENETGKIGIYPCYVLESDGKPNPFIWEEGNYACDCNRGEFFLSTQGFKDEDDFAEYEWNCSEEKYSVNLVNPNDGKVFYKEY